MRLIAAVLVLLCLVVLGQPQESFAAPKFLTLDLSKLSMYILRFGKGLEIAGYPSYRLMEYGYREFETMTGLERREELVFDVVDQLAFDEYYRIVPTGTGCAYTGVGIFKITSLNFASNSLVLIDKKRDGSFSVGMDDVSLEDMIPQDKAQKAYLLGKELFDKGKRALGLSAFCPERAPSLQVDTQRVDIQFIWLRSRDGSFDYKLGNLNGGNASEAYELVWMKDLTLWAELRMGRLWVVKRWMRDGQSNRMIEIISPIGERNQKQWDRWGFEYDMTGQEVEFEPKPFEAKKVLREGLSFLVRARKHFGVERFSPLHHVTPWF